MRYCPSRPSSDQNQRISKSELPPLAGCSVPSVPHCTAVLVALAVTRRAARLKKKRGLTVRSKPRRGGTSAKTARAGRGTGARTGAHRPAIAAVPFLAYSPCTMRVFVSSTCYDLIDLRAEVEAHLHDLGLSPVMSDRASSEFHAFDDSNSIETCLSNVRAAEVFVCILLHRYGPSLKSAGFEDVSATHLELREAKRARKKILLYVRDRLDAEFRLWLKDSKTRTAWVKDDRDRRLFSMLQEHTKLHAASKRSNWYWTFRDSLDLKAHLVSHLRAQSGRALLTSWLRAGRLPFLDARVNIKSTDSENHPVLSMVFNVRSAVPVFDLTVSGLTERPMCLGDCCREEPRTANVLIPSATETYEKEFVLQYSTEFGAKLADTFRLRYTPGNGDMGCTTELVKKKLVRVLPPEIE